MSTFFKVTNLLFKNAFKDFNLNEAKQRYFQYKKSGSNHITNRKLMIRHINNLIKDITNNDIPSLTIKNTIENLFANGKIEKLFRDKLFKVLFEKPQQDEHIADTIEFIKNSKKNTPKIKP